MSFYNTLYNTAIFYGGDGDPSPTNWLLPNLKHLCGSLRYIIEQADDLEGNRRQQFVEAIEQIEQSGYSESSTRACHDLFHAIDALDDAVTALLGDQNLRVKFHPPRGDIIGYNTLVPANQPVKPAERTPGPLVI